MKSALFYSFLFSLLVSLPAHTEVVKITGSICQTKTGLINGSGIVFMLNQEQYILSSDHVTTGQSQYCYQAQTSDLKKSSLTLISSDWETGLSLLKVNNTLTNIQTTLEDFSANSEVDSDVIAVGFPSSSSKLLADAARVVISRSDRTPFVSSGNLIEVIGTQIEFGMSGGALLSAKDKKIIGMISHQRLLLVAGNSTQIESGSMQKENHGLIIPSSQIVEWINHTINGEQSLYSSIGHQTITGAGILFKESKTPRLMIADKGGDGVGVGGDENDTASVSIELSVSALNEFNTKSNTRNEFDWIRQILPQLVKNGKITVNAALVLNPETENIEKIHFKSAAHFIKLLRTGTCIPLTDASANSTLQLAQLKSELMSSAENSESKNLTSLLLSLIDIKTQYGMVSIPKNYLENLQNHPEWKLFFEQNFELAVKAKTFTLSL